MNSQTRQADSFEKAAMLMLVSRMIVKLLGLASTLVLVRLISPEDFGLIAIAMAIYGFIELFGSFGFQNALIQKGNPSKQDYDVAFTIGLIFGLFACTSLFFLSDYIADYFNDTRLTEILNWLSLMFLIAGFQNIKTTQFQIDMNFTKELYFQIAPKSITFAINVSLAYYLKSYHALLYGMLASSVIVLLISYIMVPYVPRITLTGANKIWLYSKWIMLNSFLQYFNNKFSDIILGKYLSSKAVGLYSISSELCNLPLTDICAPVNKASFAAYSKVKDSINEIEKLYAKCSSITNTFTLPISIGLIMTSHLFVPTVLGEQWLDATQLINIMSLTCIISVIGTNASYVILALGNPKHVFAISAARTILFIIASMLMIEPLGLSSIAFASLLATTTASIAFIVYIFMLTKIGLSSLLPTLYRPYISAATMAISLLFFQSGNLLSSPYLNLAVQVILGACIYCISLFAIWKLAGCPEGIEQDLIEKIKKSINKNYSADKNQHKNQHS